MKRHFPFFFVPYLRGESRPFSDTPIYIYIIILYIYINMLLAGYNIMYHISWHFLDFPRKAIMNIYTPHGLSPISIPMRWFIAAAKGHMSACQFWRSWSELSDLALRFEDVFPLGSTALRFEDFFPLGEKNCSKIRCGKMIFRNPETENDLEVLAFPHGMAQPPNGSLKWTIPILNQALWRAVSS